MKRVRCVTLLHLSSVGTSINIASSDKRHQQFVYISNANLLAASLARFGIDLTVITNDPSLVLNLATTFGAQVIFEILAADFQMVLPNDIAFRSAHYKIEAYGVVANSFPNDYVLFLDSDMVMIATSPDWLVERNPNQSPMYYDMTRQALGSSQKGRIQNDICMITGFTKLPFWCGGEFVGGDASFYKDMFSVGMKFLPAYLARWQEFNHIGDETITTASVAQLLDSRSMVEAGSREVVTRYWSGRTRHKQSSWRTLEGSLVFLHLPQDKLFLARYQSKNSNGFDLKKFKRALRMHHFLMSIRRLAASVFYSCMPAKDPQRTKPPLSRA